MANNFDSPAIMQPLIYSGFFDTTSIAYLLETNQIVNRMIKMPMLMLAIVRGEQEAAEKIIAAHPKLLLKKGHAVDHSGRTIIATPFQAALGADDELMWQMMMGYFEILEIEGVIASAEKTMKRQYEAQFPFGNKETPADELKPYYTEIASAICHNTDNGEAAINAFRQYINENITIKTGKHFNMQHLLAACLVFIDDPYDFNTIQRQTFWKKVIGYIQRVMPMNYIQAHCCGLNRVNHNIKVFKRTCLFGYGTFVFPLKESSGLGFDYAIRSIYSGKPLTDVIPSSTEMSNARHNLIHYLNLKENRLNDLRNILNRPHSPQHALEAVLKGNEKQARVLIRNNPEFLLQRLTAVDFSGRQISATPFQGALGAEDSDMWQMMIPYFELLETKGFIESADYEIKRQFDEQYPNGIRILRASKLQPQYNELAKAIINHEDKGDSAISVFRKKLSKEKTITSGKHFNMQHLLAAYQAYIDHYVYMDERLARRFWINVVGHLQRQIPAHYAQKICCGFKFEYITFKFERTLAFNKGDIFFPIEEGTGLGVDAAIRARLHDNRGFISPYEPSDREVMSTKEDIRDYCYKKSLSLCNLQERLKQLTPSSSYCVIS